jgi:hypothetical protein
MTGTLERTQKDLLRDPSKHDASMRTMIQCSPNALNHPGEQNISLVNKAKHHYVGIEPNDPIHARAEKGRKKWPIVSFNDSSPFCD